MKPTTLAVVLSVAVGASCLVNSHSDKLACASQADCTAPRVCEMGYCVVDHDACPAECNGGCDASGTCMITGQGGDSITCPDGKQCTITCSGDACHDIDCTDASCTITCIGDNACHDITCGSGDCIIACTGTNACNNVTCGTQNAGQRMGRCRVSCAGTNGCGDVTCSNTCDCVIDGCTNGDCGALSCPRANGSYCTGTGGNGVPCTDTTSGCSC
jgi:hypothetical protein